jgi:hypothetical protein
MSSTKKRKVLQDAKEETMLCIITGAYHVRTKAVIYKSAVAESHWKTMRAYPEMESLKDDETFRDLREFLEEMQTWTRKRKPKGAQVISDGTLPHCNFVFVYVDS